MPSRLYTDEDGGTRNYTLRKQRERYATDKDFVAYSRLKYYRKKYKDNDDFFKIINSKKTNIEKLVEVKYFNKLIKETLKLNKISN